MVNQDGTAVTTPVNLVLFIADEFRGDVLRHLGNAAACTPRLDELVAADAVSFRNAFCQNPVCVPSRIALMTGWYPHTRGHRTQSYLLRACEPNLLRRLRSQGYYVWWAGKNDMFVPQVVTDSCDLRYEPATSDDILTPRVDNWTRWWPTIGPGGYYSHYVGRLPQESEEDIDRRRVRGALDFLTTRSTDRPFCLVLSLVTPHCPYGVSEPWYSLIDRSRVPAPTPPPVSAQRKPSMMLRLRAEQGLGGWTEEQWRELRATYYGMCARTDALFGELIDGLRAAGVYDHTAVIMTSDHGDYAGDFGLPEKAQNLFEDALIRVPLVIKPPRQRPARAGISDALVELVDLPATIEDLCGLDREYTHFGRSLMPVVTGHRTHHRSSVLCEGGRLSGERPAMEMQARQGPEGLYFPRMRVQRSDDVAHGKAVMVRTVTHKYVHRIAEPCELYDLTEDPLEQVNRIGDRARRPLVADLSELLLSRMIQSGDWVPTEEDRR